MVNSINNHYRVQLGQYSNNYPIISQAIINNDLYQVQGINWFQQQIYIKQCPHIQLITDHLINRGVWTYIYK